MPQYNLIYLIFPLKNEVNEADGVGDTLLLRLFCQKNEVENEVFIVISRHNVTESTNVSTDCAGFQRDRFSLFPFSFLSIE